MCGHKTAAFAPTRFPPPVAQNGPVLKAGPVDKILSNNLVNRTLRHLSERLSSLYSLRLEPHRVEPVLELDLQQSRKPLLVFTASSGRIGVDFLQRIGLSSLNWEDTRLRLMRILQIAFPFAWLFGTVITPDTPLALVLLGANANNLLLIPMAYAVVHLAMRAEGSVRMPP